MDNKYSSKEVHAFVVNCVVFSVYICLFSVATDFIHDLKKHAIKTGVKIYTILWNILVSIAVKKPQNLINFENF